jgi:uncharacterized protein (TIGR02145 family)
LGDKIVAGGKLKEAGITHWLTPNVGATNETGFTALAGGHRSYNGAFTYIGSNGFWWSTTGYSTERANYRVIDYGYTSIDNYFGDVRNGFSVRCVKD